MSSLITVYLRRALFICSLLLGLGFSTAAPAALNEAQEARVNAMLTELGKQSTLTFVRNGSEHSASEAESHLRLKLSKTRKRLNTAEQFIDNVASKSSISGTPYEVRIPGQSSEKADVYLHALLKKTDAEKGVAPQA